MTDSITVRTAEPADCAAIAQLMSELNREEGYEVQSDAEHIAAALFDKNNPTRLYALVAQTESELIGALLYYAGYDTLSASYGHHLADVVVTHSHRKQGIGRALMAALAKQTLVENKAWVSLTVLKRNRAAHEFYTTLGMTQVDVDFFAMGKTALAQL